MGDKDGSLSTYSFGLCVYKMNKYTCAHASYVIMFVKAESPISFVRAHRNVSIRFIARKLIELAIKSLHLNLNHKKKRNLTENRNND